MKKSRYICMILALSLIFIAGCNIDDNGTGTETTTVTSAGTEETSVTTTETTVTTETTMDHSDEDAQLKDLLPERSGFIWKYLGFAEYGHRMAIDAITDENDITTYYMTGSVDDMSDNESDNDFSLSVRYVIKDGELKQYTSSEMMMDSVYKEIVLIKTPLEKGAKWTGTAITKDGSEEELTCEITEVATENDSIVYTVRYDQTESGYYEIRKIRENTGVIAYNRLFRTDDGDFDMGYSLYEEMTGYPEEISLKSILPPFDTDLRYFGLAEYGHFVKWTGTSTSQNRIIYEFNGYFNDGSGIPGSFKVNYVLDRNSFTITENVVENTRDNNGKINSIISDMIILKAPLVPGNSWKQDIVIDGEDLTMDALITGVKVDQGNPYWLIYTVRYTIDSIQGYFDDRYIQERSFKTGRGMISFSQLMEGDIGISGKDLEDAYLVEQALINHMFGYSQDQVY